MNDEAQSPITGDEIILSPNGLPWPTAKDAERALKASNRDPDKFGTMTYEGGYAIASLRKILAIREKQIVDQNSAIETSRIPAPMKFHKVRIHPRGSDNESNTVLLSFNNDAFVATRGMDIILDEPHMEILRNACSEDLQPVDAATQAINPERALMANNSIVQRFPFENKGEATREEFEKFIRDMRGHTERALQAQRLKAVGATA